MNLSIGYDSCISDVNNGGLFQRGRTQAPPLYRGAGGLIIKRIIGALLLLSVMFVLPVLAQTVDNTTAYRLVFLAACSHSTDSSVQSSARAANAVALGASNGPALLERFCKSYDLLVASYNKSIEPGDDATQAAFVSRLSTLTESAINELKAYNGPNWPAIDAYVQGQKVQMGKEASSASSKPSLAPADFSGGCCGYTYYVSYGVNASNLYQTVLIDGTSTNMGACVYDPYHGQWQPPGCQSVTHTPQIYNVVNSYGGWSYGSPVIYNQYLSFQTTVAAPITEGDNPPNGYTGAFAIGTAQIYCSAARGIITAWSWAPHLLPSFTKTKSIVPTVYHYVEAWCTADTTPPLVDITEIVGASQDFYWTVSLCTDFPNNDYHFTKCTSGGYSYPSSTSASTA